MLVKFQGPRDYDEVGKKDAAGKQQEAGDDYRDNQLLFLLVEAGNDKFANEVKNDRKGEYQARVQTDLKDAHEALNGTENNQLGIVSRLFHGEVDDIDELLVEKESDDRGDQQGSDHLHEGAAQILEVLEKGFLGVIKLLCCGTAAEFDEFLQEIHCVITVPARSGTGEFDKPLPEKCNYSGRKFG